MKSTFVPIVCALAIWGCAGPSEMSPQPSANTCPVHRVPLLRIAGYAPSGGTMADPSLDYVRFMAEAESQYPCVRPWFLSEKPRYGWRSKWVACVCTECESSFQNAFVAYRELSEDAKQARFSAVLDRNAEKHQAEADSSAKGSQPFRAQ